MFTFIKKSNIIVIPKVVSRMQIFFGFNLLIHGSILCGTGRLQCFFWQSDLQTVLCWRDYGQSRTKIWNVAKKSDHLTASALAL